MKKGPLIILALLFAWLGCDDNDKAGCKDIKTMTLQPSLIDTIDFDKQGAAYWSCWPATCFDEIDYFCTITVNESKEVQVGYDYHYDNGTPPCNCWEYVDCIFRGGVRFDFGALQGKDIVGAKLKWTDRGQCAANLYVPIDDWGELYISPPNQVVNPWPPNSSGPGELEVGDTVRDWVQGKAPNHGWLFVGPDESFPNQWYEDAAEIGPALLGTHKCTSAVKGFELKVLYTD